MVAWSYADGTSVGSHAPVRRSHSSNSCPYHSLSCPVCVPLRGSRKSGWATDRSSCPLPDSSASGSGASTQPGRGISVCLEGPFDRPCRFAQTSLEDLGGEACGFVSAGRTQRSAVPRGLIYARSHFYSHHRLVLRCRLVVRERLRALMSMDFVIALLTAVGLGVYLFYALLRPEKF